MKEKFTRFLKSILTGMKSPTRKEKIKAGFDRNGVPYLDVSDRDTADFIAGKLRKTHDLELWRIKENGYIPMNIDQTKPALHCLKILTDLRRNDYTKRIMKARILDVIRLISPEISEMNIEDAYQKLHPERNDDGL